MNSASAIPSSERYTTGPALWQRAKQIIPGGNQLLSKRAERFLPGLWPAYYQQAKGCEVWDLDGRHYYDFAQMGVGSCVLGYADPDVNRAVIAAIEKGSMCTLNCPEEVELAERLLALHPWADMTRFARSGGEACVIAVRIARAASGESKVAFCGYHGWHDWYLAANLSDARNLDGQLMPGLEPAGVPEALRGTAIPFGYNDLNSLEELVKQHGDTIGVIIMEPERGSNPAPGFLQGVRSIADRINAILIFDEVTSGFRINLGGIHLTLGVAPDLAVFGKGMSNGFPLAAVLGRRRIMEHALDTFISSTFWTERTGFAAGLTTLEKMERLKVQDHLVSTGARIIAGLREAANQHGLSLTITGIPPLIYFKFEAPDPLAAQTFYAQEMLERGYLVGGAIYTTYAYTDAIIDAFLRESERVFGRMKRHLDQNDLNRQLKGEVIHAGFRRLA